MSRWNTKWAARMPSIVLFIICSASASAVYYAHYQQITEKQTMRAGVIRDIQRDRLKRKQMEEELMHKDE